MNNRKGTRTKLSNKNVGSFAFGLLIALMRFLLSKHVLDTCLLDSIPFNVCPSVGRAHGTLRF